MHSVNNYNHIWTSISNPDEQWSYGAVKNTGAGIWSAQIPEPSTDEQVATVRTGGLCAIHLDTRDYISEHLLAITDTPTTRFCESVATGFDGECLLQGISRITPDTENQAQTV